MIKKPEKPFIINGVKSWIHCLECKFYRTENTSKDEQSPISYHYHDYIELLYATDADVTIWLDGEKHSFKNGDLAIINSKTPHAFTFNETSTYICVKFLPQILYADESSLFEFKYVQPFLLENSHQKIFGKHELCDIDVQSTMLEIMDEWTAMKPAYELVIRANILKLFSSIIRYWNANNITSHEAVINDTIKSALEYLAENFSTATETEVAEYCNVSYNHLSFTFKNVMGKSFSEYITFLRLREAERLLLSTDKSITEIALSSGFSTSSYFISIFKKNKGITPKQFRAKIHNR